MKCVHTIAGMLAIVGLGYITGVGHSLVRTMPVILGARSMPTSAPKADPLQADPQTNPPTDPEQEQASPDANPVPAPDTDFDADFDARLDARLDAPVPEGMLTLRQAHEMWIDGAYFVDSRHKYEYDAGHISGAAHLTAETFFTNTGQAEIQTIPPDAPVVIYCLGGDECEASKNTLALLQQFGYTDLAIMGVGYDEWAAAGLPTDSTTGEDSP